MTPWSPPLWLGAAVTLAMAGGWWWQRRRANAGIVDAIWAAGLAAAAVFYALVGDGATLPRLLLALLGGAWGLRLAWYLWTRVRSEDEDGRYRRLRAAWNGHQGRFFAFFQFQALLVVLFSLPLLAVARNPVAQATAWTVLGVAVWLGSVAGEALADRQLARFRADPGSRGRVCDRGLWRYSRHPNYFFEWLHWFAYAFLAVGSPVAWLAWTGPLLMFVFLRWLSGVPWTEQQALRTRGAAYRDYQRRTPMFFPWFPRDHAADPAHEDAP
jgi:steroid 5-alpha reductase family enzyme